MSIEAGLVLILFVSVAVEIAVCACLFPAARWIAAFIVPIVASAGLYWLPNLSRFHDTELRTWFLLFFMFWCVPSVIACLVAASVFAFVKKRRHGRPLSEANEQKRSI